MAEENSMSESPTVGSLYNTSLADIKLGMDPLSALQQDTTPFVPPIPDGTPIPPQVNTELTGDYLSGPAPGANPNVTANKGTSGFVNAAVNAIHDNNWAKDPYKYGRTYSYGAGYKAMNFDRYYSYNKFKSLGFSPYRDNDAYYNEKGSWWDDFSRMSGQWLNIVGGVPRSIWGDEKAANETMMRGMEIGRSTRGGAGAWITNFGLNSAYTVGIIGEIWAENLALGAIEAASLGTATPEVIAAAAARNTMLFGKLGKGIAGISNFIKEMKAAGTAKEFFTWAKMGEAAKGTATYLNPFARTFETSKNILTGAKGFDLLQNKAKVALGFGDFYRDLREINVAHSEARMEGEGAAVDYQDSAIDEFYALNGRMPNEEESRDIFDRAQAVKGSVVLANDIGIYLTNKIAFHDLFEGIRPTAKLSKMFTEGFKETLKRASIKDFKIGMDVVSPGAKTAVKAASDFVFKSGYSPLSRKYFLGNLGEALQENYQETVQKAAIDYYSNIQKDPTQVGYYNAVASIGKGLEDQFNSKGLDTFLQGYLMGSLIQGAGVGINKAGDYIVKSKEQREQAKTNRQDYINNTINAVNTVGRNVLTFGRGAKLTDALTEIRQGNAAKRAAKERGDEKAMHDMGDEVNINHFHTVVSSGNTKILLDHFDDLLSLEDNDLLNAADVSDPSAAGEVRAKIEKAKERLIEYDKKYKYQQRTAPNPYNPDLFDIKKNPDAYYFELDRYNAYEQKMKDILFATEDHERIAERLSGIYNSTVNQTGAFKNLVRAVNPGNAIANTVGSDITMLLDPAQRNTFFSSIKSRIEVLSNGTPEQKKEAADLEVQNKLLKDWVNLVHNVLTETKADKRAIFNPLQLEGAKERARHRPGAKVKTAKGEEGVITDVMGSEAKVKLADKSIITVDRSKLEVLQDSDQLSLDFEGDNISEIDFAINTLYNTYEEYIKHVSKTNKGYVFNDHLHSSFRQILDFLTLELDKEDIVTTLNTLNDPTFNNRYEAILTEVQRTKRQQDLAAKVEALNKFYDLKGDNDMLNEIYDLGVRVLPEDVEKLKDFTIVDFYDQTGKEYLDYSSDKYKQIVGIVEKYASQAHRVVGGRKIEEEGQSQESLFMRLFNAAARPKLKNDQRQYRDIATQFGFSPTAKDTKVNTRDVLKAITESKFATDREKTLARRMLTLVTPQDTISFVRNLTVPGEYNEAAEEVSIDARYSSNEFATGKKGLPIEHVILNQLLQAVTRKGLKTDSVFAEKITKLREAAIKYQKTSEYKNKYGDKPLFGLINNAEFISAALTNDTFQSMLKDVSYTATGKVADSWVEFVNSIKKFFSRLFGIDISNTLLDEALYVITSKLGAEPIGETKPGEKPTPEVNVITPVQEIKLKNPVLFAKLIDAYKAYAKRDGKTIPTEDTEIEESLGFKNFIESHSDALDLINATVEIKPTAKAPAPAPEPVVPTEAPKGYEQELDNLLNNFNPETELNSMSGVNSWGVLRDNNEVFASIGKNKFVQWNYQKVEDTNDFKQGKKQAVKIAEELRRLQALLDEQVRALNDKYDIVTEEPTQAAETTAGVFTPTTPYGTPTGEPVTTATTSISTDARTDIERRVNNTISKVFGSESLFDFSTNQPGKVVNNEFIPDNLGSQLFNAINKTLKGEVVKTDKAEAERLFKEYAKTVHPDKNQSEQVNVIAEAFFKAMGTAKDQGRVDILNELKNKFDEELAALEGKVVEPKVSTKDALAEEKVKTDIIELRDVFKWDNVKSAYRRTAKLVKDSNNNIVAIDVVDVDRVLYRIDVANIDPKLLQQLKDLDLQLVTFRSKNYTKEQKDEARKTQRKLYTQIASNEADRLEGKEVASTVKKQAKTLTEAIKDINNMDELNAWYERGIEEGVPSEILDQKRQEKINDLAKKVIFTDLTHGITVQLIGDNRPRIVYDPTGQDAKEGKEIKLLFLGNFITDNLSEAVKVTPENINSVVNYIVNDAMKESTSTTPTITKEQVTESDNTIDSLTKVNVVDEKVIDDMVNKATSTENVEDLWNAVGKEIDDNTNCSTE